ncbi:MAG: ATP-binding protein [candidate division WOR-3 bacterium]
MNKNFVQRDVFPSILSSLSEKEITVIIGPRQTGKTTILSQLKEHMIEKQNIPAQKIKIFNLDLMTDLALFSSQTDFLKYLEDELKIHKNLYLFIDEAQRLENPGLFLKGIYDQTLPVKFVVTGSSSLEMKSKFSESLAGRKRIFRVYPFSFFEFLKHKDPTLFKILSTSDKISSYHHNHILSYLYNFIVFGGYPRIVLEENKEQKIKLLEEIYSSYIERDIIGFMRIKNPFAFNRLVTLLAGQIGQMANFHEICTTIKMNYRTLENYLSILENTFILSLVRPYATNLRKELTKMPKVYYVDTGFRNFALKDFTNFENHRDRGSLLENFCYSEFSKRWNGAIYFWRTKEKAEVDFVLKDYYGNIIPLEIKAQEMSKPSITRGLQSFIKTYPVKKAYVINLALKEKIMLNSTQIEFIRPYEILSIT